MANRLRDVCALPESEPLWRAGCGFVVRDLPWTVEKVRVIPPFEFENWAVIALGGIPNKVQVGDMGVDVATVKITGKGVTIHCLEIGESSVSISIDGIDGTRELKLSAN